jgi:hypothetical protein
MRSKWQEPYKKILMENVKGSDRLVDLSVEGGTTLG